MKKESKITKQTYKKPTKKEIDEALQIGLMLGEKTKSVVDVIKRDLHHRDDNNQTQLTRKFDNILKGDDIELIEKTKGFIKKQVQTLVKEKAVQLAVLGDERKEAQVTLKKVTKSMIENVDGLYADNFNEKDFGSFRVVKMHKKTEDLTIHEELMKWMRSQKKNGLWTGSKGQEKDPEFYDVATVINLCKDIQEGNI